MVVQMKDLGNDNLVHLSESIHIDHAKLKPNQPAKLGDIIFRSRGQTNTAALLNEDAKSTIAAVHCFACGQTPKRLSLNFCFGGLISHLHRLALPQGRGAP